MEQLNVATPEGLAAPPRPSSRSSGRERCQKEQCAETARKLKAECKELKAQLVPLQKNMTVLVQGETRAIHAELVEKNRQIDFMKTGFAAAKTNRSYSIASLAPSPRRTTSCWPRWRSSARTTPR